MSIVSNCSLNPCLWGRKDSSVVWRTFALADLSLVPGAHMAAHNYLYQAPGIQTVHRHLYSQNTCTWMPSDQCRTLSSSETSLCGGWWLTQKLTAGHTAEGVNGVLPQEKFCVIPSYHKLRDRYGGVGRKIVKLQRSGRTGTSVFWMWQDHRIHELNTAGVTCMGSSQPTFYVVGSSGVAVIGSPSLMSYWQLMASGGRESQFFKGVFPDRSIKLQLMAVDLWVYVRS